MASTLIWNYRTFPLAIYLDIDVGLGKVTTDPLFEEMICLYLFWKCVCIMIYFIICRGWNKENINFSSEGF